MFAFDVDALETRPLLVEVLGEDLHALRHVVQRTQEAYLLLGFTLERHNIEIVLVDLHGAEDFPEALAAVFELLRRLVVLTLHQIQTK